MTPSQKSHSPVEGCLTCHRPHGAGEPKLTVEPIADLCAQCHDLKDKEFATAHLGIDAKLVRCMSCHDPHSSPDPKFFKGAMHPPFAARECATCHVVPKK